LTTRRGENTGIEIKKEGGPTNGENRVIYLKLTLGRGGGPTWTVRSGLQIMVWGRFQKAVRENKSAFEGGERNPYRKWGGGRGFKLSDQGGPRKISHDETLATQM